METEKEELLTRLEKVLDELPKWQKEVLWLDVLNEYEERNKILKREVGVNTQVSRHKYLARLRKKVRELCEGTWKPKHGNLDKPTLRGF